MAALLMAGCAADDDAETAEPEESSSPSASVILPSEIGQATEAEIGQDWMAGPDINTPEEHELSDEERLEHIRLGATHPHIAETCAAEELSAQVHYSDAAMGTRGGSILLRNDAEQDCTLQGHPGIGARGEYGHLSHNEISQTVTAEEPSFVRLGPGEIAVVPLIWTGELAGAESEWVETLYVQLAQDQVPVVADVDKDLVVNAEDAAPDIGMTTRIRVEPFELATDEYLQVLEINRDQ